MKPALFALLVLFSFSEIRSVHAETAARPNIVVILADDLGYADVGFTGGKTIKTPHLDRLAAAGARLDQYYVQPLCSPTRAALLTGRYPMRYGMQVGVLLPWEQRNVPFEERLLPQALKEVGYTTAITGKWHLGHHSRACLPTKRGFDHQYGHYCGQIDYFTHERQEGFDWHRNDKECRDEGYSTHLIAKETVRLIQDFSAQKPFFLYVPFNAVHSPWQVPEEYKKPYADLPEPRRTYAGMLACMDEAVGQIHQAIRQKGFHTNTLFIFSSDNGGPSPGQVTDNGLLRGGKGGVYEGGTRVCAFATWEGKIKAGSTLSTPIHVTDWYPTLLKLAGAPAKQPLPVDGTDIWPTLANGKHLPNREILLNTTPDTGALRLGDWKIVVRNPDADAAEKSETSRAKRKSKQASGLGQVELFNLADDMGEKHDLAAKNPEKLKTLRQRYDLLARQAVNPGNESKPADFKAPRVWGETATK